MATSIPQRSRKWRTANRTSMAVSLEQSIAMKKIVMDRNAPCIPQEIVTNILKRLPVKSLIRFQCVCKDWKNLLKTPSFIAEHLRHSTQQNLCLLFDRRGDECTPCLINRDMQVLEYQIPPSIDSSVRSCSIVGSSNGLLCLATKSLYLWNPATREVLQVPKVPNLRRHPITCVGFGYSPIVNDYKIVRLTASTLDDDRVYLMQVFSLRTMSWKEVEAGKLKGIILLVLNCGFTFDGAIFLFGFGYKLDEEEKVGDRLISFDMATEAFTLIAFPRSALISNTSRLTTYENKLALLSNCRIENTKSSSINLWVMDKCIDASGERWIWTKIYTSNPYPYSALLLTPLTVWRNEIFWEPDAFSLFFGRAKDAVDKDEQKFVLCNLHTNELKMLAIGKYPFETQIWNYAESLVPVGNIHIEAS